MWFMFAIFVDVRENTGAPEFPLAIEQGARLPAGPRLQAKPANEIYDFRLRESAELDGYSWVDKGAGTVRIPIAEAMRLTVERGLPSRAPMRLDAARSRRHGADADRRERWTDAGKTKAIEQ